MTGYHEYLNQYDDDEYDDSKPESLATVSEETNGNEHEDLSDEETRLEEAICYKALLQNPLFDANSSPVALKVEKDIRNFVRSRLRILLGLESAKVEVKDSPSPFTPEQVAALQVWASRLLEKGTAPKSEPVVNKAVLPEKPKVQVPQLPTSPVVNRAQVTKPAAKSVKAEAPKESPKRVGRPKKSPDAPVTETDLVKKVRRPPKGKTASGQTLPAAGTPGFSPPMNGAQLARVIEQQALTYTPPAGMLSSVLSNMNAKLIDE